MPLQLRRILTLLISLILIFVVVRHFLVPESFGELGHYRSYSLIENAAHNPKYIGNSDCEVCHEAESSLINEGLHKTIKCETCHGPGADHIESNEADDIIKPQGREFCGQCHQKNAARPSNIIKQVDIMIHNVEESECTNCHNPHEPWK